MYRGGSHQSTSYAGGRTGRQFPPEGNYGMQVGPRMGSGGSASGVGMGMGMGIGMGGGMGMNIEPVFPAIKLRGLPFDVKEEDIRMFLGCDPIDILMVRKDGRLSGEAFVVLSAVLQAEIAMSKNRTYMGRRYIEVYKAKKMDYYRAIASEVMDGGVGVASGSGVYNSMGQGLGINHAQTPTGNGSYVQDVYSSRTSHNHTRGSEDDGYGGSTIVKLRGLPFQVEDEDIIRWFQDSSLGIAPLSSDSVYIVSEHGRSTGIAFVEFPSSHEAAAAMGKNKQMMGSRYIEIFPASRSDLDKYRLRDAY
ncbi:hypothetical protein CEUSTIGMA_g12135.t1 [Chlamydomonas eustigma]|uniref:RRM domain-containing protein n=1 Tax=Chlamydomonas eustigma TaxID=1157962 RepID=A0A250XNY3_9CHLO|nr:hypothetical protein CEUSTIGMA_g12135.t1 [Chlamydomonas eustigma]|eukprot:GAX84713.1 hypothetical protein CEUSTIGMA_g12135.t1 [Chlamydomonas eustigma]